MRRATLRPMSELVLASTSRYRRELLARLGLPFSAVSPPCDEEVVKAEGLPAHELVARLARAKAESVAPLRPDALIIGSDQVAELDGEILGKPHTEARARAQLGRMAGREHRLLTAICVLDARSGHTAEVLDVHHLRMRALDADQIARYVERDRPLDCAGSYKIEGPGIALFESIRGEDFTAVIGLPLTRLVGLLSLFGWTLP